MEERIKFISAVTTEKNPEQAVELLVESVRSQLRGNSGASSLDLMILFDQLLCCQPPIQVGSTDGAFYLVLAIADPAASFIFLTVHPFTTVNR